jgi:hypothetical protein
MAEDASTVSRIVNRGGFRGVRQEEVVWRPEARFRGSLGTCRHLPGLARIGGNNVRDRRLR